ncbi:MAG TPA: septal ring lytic transglycosylase RlpA family protein [Gammaproteobacteria bacterium]|nr:septal ring lytic transglycosylase RlpA family protein [Gammaproteobacteria bacterium]
MAAFTTVTHCTAALLPVLLIAACAPLPPEDRAPSGAFDAESVPDAVPRPEPLSRYGNPESYVVFGERYEVLRDARGYVERGIASWYGEKFHGARTSSGEPYDMYAMTAAHKTLPLPSYVRVTNLENGRSVVVRVNDRGPFKDNRLIDLSYAAALKLDIVRRGTGLVEVRALDPQAPPGEMPATTSPVALGHTPAMYLQVGAFAQEANALYLRQRLERAGVGAVHVLAGEVNGEMLYRVRLGPFAAVEALDNASRAVESLGLRDLHVVVE